jgi:hypothetical protein
MEKIYSGSFDSFHFYSVRTFPVYRTYAVDFGKNVIFERGSFFDLFGKKPQRYGIVFSKLKKQRIRRLSFSFHTDGHRRFVRFNRYTFLLGDFFRFDT